MLKFLYGKPALSFGKSVCVADLHIGYEVALREKGVRLGSSLERMKEELFALLLETGAERLILLGDVKHSIPNPEREELMELRNFFSTLAEKAELVVVKGNHDGNIEALAREAKVFASAGTVVDGVGLFHGNAWPAPEVVEQEWAVLGHSHPCVEVEDAEGRRMERAWVVGKADAKKLCGKYPKANHKLRLVLMPAFNPLLGGCPLNKGAKKGMPGPFLARGMFKFADAQIHLLNGVGIGKLSGLMKKGDLK